MGFWKRLFGYKDDEYNKIEKDIPSTGTRPEAPFTINTFQPFDTDPKASFDANSGYVSAPAQYAAFNGTKYPGGFGTTKIQITDYWTLRQRSVQLFNDNLFARGLIRRLITNEINTGLSVESIPEELILGLPEDSLENWSEDVENRFVLYSKDAEMCDYRQRETFGELQRTVRRESLIAGDVLIRLRRSQEFKTPQIEVISGDAIQTPLAIDSQNINKDHTIVDGVELDKHGRQVAYWVTQLTDSTTTLKSERIPAIGPKSNRRLAWLVYGTDKRHNVVRGVPMLSLILQTLNEIDKYRDAAQRKAVINSMWAMFVKKDSNKMGTQPFSGGAVRSTEVELADDGNKSPRKFNMQSYIPGMVMEELQEGETPQSFDSTGTDINYGPFENAMLQAIAWANEIPPEILQLAFSNNYSASQAAINEFKIYLNLVRTFFGEQFCQPIYKDWLIGMVANRKIVAPGFLDAWRDKGRREQFNAWVASDWSGAIKPSTDILKQAKGYQALVAEAWITNDRASRELTGTKFTKNARRIAKENELKAAMLKPRLELNNEFGEGKVEAALQKVEENKPSFEDGTLLKDDDGVIWVLNGGQFEPYEASE